MNKKKWLLRVVSLTALFCLSLGLGIFAACSPVTDNGDPDPTPDGDHTHSYTEWARSESEHWMTCPDDGAIDESTRAEHAFVGGKCACGMDEPDGHVHDWVWKHNDTEHWQFCETDEVEKDGSRAAHELTDGKCECGYEKVEGPVVELDTREFYVVGSGSGSLKNASWTQTSNDFKFTKASEADEAGNTVYTIELDLYSGDEFKIVQPNTIADNSWDDTSFGFYELATATGKFKDGGGANITVESGADGTYQFTIRTTKNGPLKANKVEWKLIKSLPSLEVTAQYEMYIIGNLKASGNNGWSNSPSKMIKMELQSDNKTFSVDVDMVTADRFKVYNVKTNQYYPTGVNNDLKVDKDGKYTVSWVVGAADPTIKAAAHVHQYTKWAYDAENHWKVCPDDNVIDNSTKAAHNLGANNTCECGYVYKETFTVTFDVDGGSDVPAQKVQDGDKATKPADPTKDGHMFGGWYQEKACQNVFDFNTPITASITVYAKWNALTEETYGWSIDDNGLLTAWKGEGTTFVIPAKVNGIAVTGASADVTADSTAASKITKIEMNKYIFFKEDFWTPFTKVTEIVYNSAETGMGKDYDSPFADTNTSPLLWNVTKLTFGPNVTDIPKGFASHLRGLTTVVIEGNITAIGSHAFWWCSSLTSFDIPAGVSDATLGTNIFSSCAKLKTVTFPQGLTQIPEAMFDGCDSLNIALPSTIKKLCARAFRSCHSLRSSTFVLPEGLTTIENDALSACVNLRNLVIPASVTSIYSGTSKTTAYVTAIGSIYFRSLTIKSDKLLNLAPTAATVNLSVSVSPLAADNGVYGKIYVPANLVDAYKAAPGWSNYAEYIEAIPETTATATNYSMPVAVLPKKEY